MKQIYNKLVRDKIPDKIRANGEEPIIRILNDKEYKKYLELKLEEEKEEVLNSKGEDRFEELADLIEVIRCLANLENKTLDDILLIADNKNEKRGSFKDKIFLEGVD